MSPQMSKETEILTKVAWLYYYRNLTQLQISKKLGFSRIKISRLLKKARREGIVEIRLANSISSIELELEQDLEVLFDLTEAIVVASGESQKIIQSDLGKATAWYLERKLQDNFLIGVGLARTLYSVPPFLEHNTKKNGTLMSVTGGYTNSDHDTTRFHVLWSLADALDAKVEQLLCPFVVSSAAARDVLLDDPHINNQIQRAKECSFILTGIGTVVDEIPLIELGYTDKDCIHEVIGNGAVGEIMGSFFDIEGNPVKSSLDDKVIGLNLDDLRKASNVVAVAGGREKTEAILGALHTATINTLITDKVTAETLIEFMRR